MTKKKKTGMKHRDSNGSKAECEFEVEAGAEAEL